MRKHIDYVCGLKLQLYSGVWKIASPFISNDFNINGFSQGRIYMGAYPPKPPHHFWDETMKRKRGGRGREGEKEEES